MEKKSGRHHHDYTQLSYNEHYCVVQKIQLNFVTTRKNPFFFDSQNSSIRSVVPFGSVYIVLAFSTLIPSSVDVRNQIKLSAFHMDGMNERKINMRLMGFTSRNENERRGNPETK